MYLDDSFSLIAELKKTTNYHQNNEDERSECSDGNFSGLFLFVVSWIDEASNSKPGITSGAAQETINN